MNIQEQREQVVREIKSVWASAEAEGREATPSERRQVEKLLAKAERLQAQAQVESTFGGVGNGGLRMTDPKPLGRGRQRGRDFVASKGYGEVKDAGSRGRTWSTGLVDCGSFEMYKGTMLEGSGAPGSGTGGGFVPVPQVVPGVVDKLFQPLSIESLLLAGQASGNTVRYATEGTATSGAAGVAEAGLKPESTIAVSTLDEPVKKVATSIVVSDELLDDAPAVTTFVNGQLSLFVQIEVERQLFRGTSGGNEVQGLLTSRGVPVYAPTGGTANRAETLFKAMNGVRGSAFVEPGWIALNPADYEAIRLSKDTANQYFGGGPFLGSYGNGQSVSASGQATGAVDTLWGKQVRVTSALGAGTALVGTPQAAQVWSRGGLSVEATNSHASNFTLDLTAIRAERRLALTVFRPGAFCEVRFI
jgi:HK97 family phage major capsid protein